MSTESGNFLFPELSPFFLLKEVRLLKRLFLCIFIRTFANLVPIFVDHLNSEKQMHISGNSVVCSTW